MTTEKTWNPQSAWRQLRFEAEAAKNYPMPYSLNGDLSNKNNLLEQMLPSLLYVKAVAILDDSLKLWLEIKGHRLSKPSKHDLNGRLTYMRDKGLLDSAEQLFAVKDLRNELAHEPGKVCDWSVLERDIKLIEISLLTLNIASKPTGKLECVGERSKIYDSQEPGVAWYRTYTFAVKEDGNTVLELSWVEKSYNSTS